MLATAEEAARFVVSGDLAALAQGGAIRAATAYYKRLRDPNRVVAKLFEKAEQHLQAPPTGRSESAGVPGAERAEAQCG